MYNVNICVVSFQSGVLDEDRDVLLNVNIVDDEKAAKNVELKKGKPGYNPYEEEEVDEYGNVSISVSKVLQSCVYTVHTMYM